MTRVYFIKPFSRYGPSDCGQSGAGVNPAPWRHGMKQDGITNPITLADKYRAIYMSMWRMNERHWRFRVATPGNIIPRAAPSRAEAGAGTPPHPSRPFLQR